MSSEPYLLECRQIYKRFGGIAALNGVEFSLARGEIHGLVGSNGAGKSTLMRVLAGAVSDYQGHVLLDGMPVHIRSPRQAAALGIAMVHQELSGIGSLCIAENLFLGRQPLNRWGLVDWRTMRMQATEFLAELKLNIDVRRRWDSYPLVVRQMVEIARVLHSGARILILDEPTSALSPPETQRLFDLLETLPARGISVILISHFIEDVLAVCHRVTVLRDGKNVATFHTNSTSKHEIIHAMLGREVQTEQMGFEGTVKLPPRTDLPPRLRVENFSLPPFFDRISLSVAAGECVALYGFVGAGHQEFAWAVAGARKPSSGQVLLNNQPLPPGDLAAAVRHGMALVVADRSRALVLKKPVFVNTTLAHLRRSVGEWLWPSREIRVALPVLAQVGCRPLEPQMPVGKLSGGNQQKVVLAKWLLGPMQVLILDEPTRGMDVAAKTEVMDLIRALRDSGVAVVLATTEPELALAHADRVVVFHRGRISAEFADQTVDRAALLRAA